MNRPGAVPFPVTIENPPPPQLTTHDVRYVSVEKDSFAQAFAWAESELARKYPGAIGTIETLKSLIQQYLAGQQTKGL